MKSMAAKSPHQHPPHCNFTPIEEGNEDEEFSQGRRSFRESNIITTPQSEKGENTAYKHFPTPLPNSEKNKRKLTKAMKKEEQNDDSTAVSCNKCRPGNKEKLSIVSSDNNNGVNRHLSIGASPNGIFKSILASLKKSPKSSDGGSSVSREEQWKIAVAEISNKLIQATRKRDEAVLEASKLKYSMAELEKKLNKLEIYCHSLKSGLEVCSNKKSPSRLNYQTVKVGDRDRVVENFLILVSEARSTVRILSRALTIQLRGMEGKVHNRVSMLLQPFDIKVSFSRNPRGLVFYLEALLNRAFFEDFESVGFSKSAPNPVLNPIDRCEANFAMFSRLQGLTWEEVLSKGTRHFSEDFSKFCDRKMSEIVAMLGWNRAWSEPLLQAFFGASKAVWFVHLLANSVHPGLPIFRVDTGFGYDPVYMEDMGGDKVKKLVPGIVRIMIAPGFYVYDNVVKCKVLCRYYNNNNNSSLNGGHMNDLSDKGLTLSPSL